MARQSKGKRLGKNFHFMTLKKQINGRPNNNEGTPSVSAANPTVTTGQHEPERVDASGSNASALLDRGKPKKVRNARRTLPTDAPIPIEGDIDDHRDNANLGEPKIGRPKARETVTVTGRRRPGFAGKVDDLRYGSNEVTPYAGVTPPEIEAIDSAWTEYAEQLFGQEVPLALFIEERLNNRDYVTKIPADNLARIIRHRDFKVSREFMDFIASLLEEVETNMEEDNPATNQTPRTRGDLVIIALELINKGQTQTPPVRPKQAMLKKLRAIAVSENRYVRLSDDARDELTALFTTADAPSGRPAVPGDSW